MNVCIMKQYFFLFGKISTKSSWPTLLFIAVLRYRVFKIGPKGGGVLKKKIYVVVLSSYSSSSSRLRGYLLQHTEHTKCYCCSAQN